MKIDVKKTISLLLSTILAFSFSSCIRDDSTEKKMYTMEAEYVDLEGIEGEGVSSAQTGVGVIWGDGTETHKKRGWSNGYYVGYTYRNGFQLDFVFQSDRAEIATLILRLASELGDISLTAEEFSVTVNDKEIGYLKMFVEGSPSMAEAVFYDRTITTAIELNVGENKISLIVNKNKLKHGSTGGPLIDCIKLQTEATLTWLEHKDNPDKRGDYLN